MGVTVWNIWANAYALLILLAVGPALIAFWIVGLIRRLATRIAAAIASILLGLVFTQLIHIFCVPGYFRAFPLHSLWHCCSAISAFLTLRIFDLVLAEAEGRRKLE